MGKKEYHGLEFELIGISGYDEVIASSGQCSYLQVIWIDAAQYPDEQAVCRDMLGTDGVDQNLYNGLWVGSGHQ